MNTGYTLIEVENFTRDLGDYFRNDSVFAEFQSELAENPEKGSVIVGAAPLRKLRWRDSRRGIGKRGGLRIIYIHIPDIKVLVLVDVYNKDEADDLTTSEKKEFQEYARTIVDELRRLHKRG